jgi:hypothetical protein
MAVKLVMYTTPTMSEVDCEIKGFASAREAAHYRDTHYDTAGKPSQIQQDHTKASSNSADDRHLADDDGSQEAPRQTIQYHKGMARENFAQFRAAAILAVVGVGFVASLIMFIVSLLS